MDILYMDEDILVCIKPARVLSTDEPGAFRIYCGRNSRIPKLISAPSTGWTGWSAA